MNTNLHQQPDRESGVNQGKNDDQWDNDTYGHIADPDSLKKKNEPQNHDEENVNASEKLKNQNIASGDEIASRNRNEDKGIGGKEN
ncbi:hypothetical protein [Pedobacter sp. Leaf176]|uniref:hypothetical protein n=1 Tax=Pedobacter sp. Leaf176 TaxID=1736286 RepID=UPI0007002A34|nr:hypothetical protein [Pedobacter sp. Leaf176]KQR65217.1 hypothetical protein ASF92_19980 [Pedobacter sp. Leaf176]